MRIVASGEQNADGSLDASRVLAGTGRLRDDRTVEGRPGRLARRRTRRAPRLGGGPLLTFFSGPVGFPLVTPPNPTSQEPPDDRVVEDHRRPDPSRVQPTSAPAAAATGAPGATPAAPATPAASTRTRRASSRGLRSVVGASVLAAVLASASTVGILSATGRPRRPLRSASPNAVPATKIITDADLPNVVEAARKSVVTITADGVSAGGFPVQHPGDRRRVGRHPDRRRLHPDQPPRRRERPVADASRSTTARSTRPRSSRSPTTTTSP